RLLRLHPAARPGVELLGVRAGVGAEPVPVQLVRLAGGIPACLGELGGDFRPRQRRFRPQAPGPHRQRAHEPRTIQHGPPSFLLPLSGFPRSWPNTRATVPYTPASSLPSRLGRSISARSVRFVRSRAPDVRATLPLSRPRCSAPSWTPDDPS